MENNFSKSNSSCMSEDIRQLAQAFLLAKKEFVVTGKSAKNNNQNYKYAKIEDIYSAVESALLKNNIIIWHFVTTHIETNIEILNTRLVHTLSGQYIQDNRLLISEKPGNQAKGAANTYMKKYAVLSLCAIGTEDDDGEEEEKYITKKENIPQPPKSNSYDKVTKDQLDIINKQLKDHVNIAERLLRAYKIEKLADLPATKFDFILDKIIEFKQVEI